MMQERRKAAEEFAHVWGYKGAERMLDTDYGSSQLSLKGVELSDDTKERRRKVEAGKNSHMVRGKTWRSKRASCLRSPLDIVAEQKQFVRLLKVLDHIARGIKGSAAVDTTGTDGNEVAGSGAQPIAGPSARKKRKLSSKTQKTPTFYGAPSKYNDRPPASAKNPKTIPFVGMVRTTWRVVHDPDDTMELQEDLPWWKEFETKIKPGDISEEDLAYLAEMEDDSNSELEGEPEGEL